MELSAHYNHQHNISINDVTFSDVALYFFAALLFLMLLLLLHKITFEEENN